MREKRNKEKKNELSLWWDYLNLISHESGGNVLVESEGKGLIPEQAGD